MKRITLKSLFLLVNLSLFGQEECKLHIQHLTDNFYVYTTYKKLNEVMYPSNSMYLVTDSGVVLFDSPWESSQFQPLLDSIFAKHNKKVVLAIATHYHDDRTAAFDFLRRKGVKTYSSKLTYELCEKYNENKASFYFTNDTIFELGDYKFETFYPGEGHTKDNIVIWFNDFKILYGGCLVKSTDNITLGNVTDANIDEWPLSIEKLINKYPNRNFVIPGHFGWSSNLGLEHTLQLLMQKK